MRIRYQWFNVYLVRQQISTSIKIQQKKIYCKIQKDLKRNLRWVQIESQDRGSHTFIIKSMIFYLYFHKKSTNDFILSPWCPCSSLTWLTTQKKYTVVFYKTLFQPLSETLCRLGCCLLKELHSTHPVHSDWPALWSGRAMDRPLWLRPTPPIWSKLVILMWYHNSFQMDSGISTTYKYGPQVWKPAYLV